MTLDAMSGGHAAAVETIPPSQINEILSPPEDAIAVNTEESANQNEETEISADPADDSGSEETAQAKRKRLGGFQKKLAQKDAKILQLEAALAALSAGAPQRAPESVARPITNKPRQDDFQTYDEWVEAVAYYNAEQALQKSEQRKQQETLQQSHERRVREAEDKYVDFHEVIADYDFNVLPKMAQEAVLHSEKGADIAYYIASNPEIGDRLARLQGIQAAIEIGKIEARLEAKQPAKTAAKSAVKVTKAPPPLTPVTTKHVGTKDLKSMGYKEYYQAQGYDKL